MNYSCPFAGENFNNYKCIICTKQPTDFFIIADGIVCPHCEKQKAKQIAISMGARYAVLKEPHQEMKLYLEAVQDYVNGEN